MTYSDQMTLLARIGFAARGLVYMLIGWFALDVALHGGKTTDNQGALGTLANAPLGHISLAVCALGFAGYAVWRLTEAITDPENRGRTLKGKFERLGYGLSGISHIMLATAAGRLALAQTAKQEGSPGDESAQGWSAWLLAQPGGVFLLVLIGMLLFAVAAAQALKACNARFDDLGGDMPAPAYVRWVGRLGYAARAVVFSLIGWFIISAALNHNPNRAGGLGEALAQLRAQDEGTVILSVVAFGLALFGLFSLIEARYRRMKVEKPDFLR
eukprot:TRINITY_DN15919_c0_g1_i12.p1 TRINITY_DN15919_c0_g1~~TRINITY_DN15919_c0_g1_i12.p1  ORF type:complete len:271 (-),score=34.99 TRINITY_DN15919_c0_g1_i12:454-1266(-)